MVHNNSGKIVQALPITSATYVGVPTGFNPKGYDIVHCNEDTTLTFNFGAGGSVVVNALQGSDFAIGDGCVAIDSTAEVIIS